MGYGKLCSHRRSLDDGCFGHGVHACDCTARKGIAIAERIQSYFISSHLGSRVTKAGSRRAGKSLAKLARWKASSRSATLSYCEVWSQGCDGPALQKKSGRPEMAPRLFLFGVGG